MLYRARVRHAKLYVEVCQQSGRQENGAAPVAVTIDTFVTGCSPRTAAKRRTELRANADNGSRCAPNASAFRNVALPGQVCKEFKFAEKIARFANLNFDVSSGTTARCIVDLAIFAGFVCRRAPPRSGREAFFRERGARPADHQKK
jgi:hypothetical protein